MGIWLLIKGIPNALKPPSKEKNHLILKMTHLSKHSLCVPDSVLEVMGKKKKKTNVEHSDFLGDHS